MAPEPHLSGLGHPQECRAADRHTAAVPAEESKTMAGPRRPRQPGQPDAGPLGADIGSFRLHMAAEGKAARTVQGYTSAVRWFAAGYLLRQAGKTSWEQVDAPDIQQWTAQLLDRYSGAYASIQFRALRQFFKWRADEEELPDPMARLRAPKVTVTAVPVFTSVELSELNQACQGRSFAARRDAAIIAVFTATGIRLSELAGICYHPGDPARSDLDLQAREIRIRGKGGTARTVKIGHQAARSLDRYLRARARHAQAWRPQLWLGVNNRGAADRDRHLPDRRPPRPPVRGDRVPAPVPAPLQPHLARPRRSRTGPDGTQRLDLPADAHPVRRQRPRRPRPPQLRPHHGRQHLTPAITASRNSARAGGRTTSRNCAGNAAKASPAWTRTPPPRKTSPGAAPSSQTPKLCPAAAAPRTRRCPMPGADPQTETMAITQGQLPHNAESRL